MFCESFFKDVGATYSTSHHIGVTQGATGLIPNQTDINNSDFADGDYDYARTASSVQNVIQFAAPEYAYQPDDIKDILNTYKSSIKLEHVISYNTPGKFMKHTVTPSGVSVSSVYSSITTGYNDTDRIYLSSDQLYKDGTDDLAYRFRLDTYRINDSNNTVNVPNATHTYETYIKSDFDTVGQSGVSGGYGLIGVNRIPEGASKHLKYIESFDKLGTFLSFNYIKPSSVNTNAPVVSYTNAIQNIAYPDVPEWNKFANGENIRFADDVTGIGTYSYINWSAPMILDNQSTSWLKRMFKDVGTYNGSFDGKERIQQAACLYPIGTGGKCILFKLGDGGNLTFNGNRFYYQDYTNKETLNRFAPIHIANLVKPVTPYGGYTKYAIENSTYIPTGCYESIGDPTQWTARVSNVRAGDAYVGIFKYNAAHLWDDAQYKNVTRMATVYAVPIESDIDLTAQYGHTFSGSGNKAYYIQDKPASFDGYSQEKEAYMYNTAYG
jgi:hypothetical protein